MSHDSRSRPISLTPLGEATWPEPPSNLRHTNADQPPPLLLTPRQSFFSRWWALQDDRTQAAVTSLVESGQLEFVNGGWVQHDEAAAHYVAMIDQTTRGHRSAWGLVSCVRRDGSRATEAWEVTHTNRSPVLQSPVSCACGGEASVFHPEPSPPPCPRVCPWLSRSRWSPTYVCRCPLADAPLLRHYRLHAQPGGRVFSSRRGLPRRGGCWGLFG